MSARKLFSVDFEKLTSAVDKVAKFIGDKKKILDDGLIKDILAADSEFSSYNDLLNSCKYLSSINEDMIY